jgi:hypothetical protein
MLFNYASTKSKLEIFLSAFFKFFGVKRGREKGAATPRVSLHKFAFNYLSLFSETFHSARYKSRAGGKIFECQKSRIVS